MTAITEFRDPLRTVLGDVDGGQNPMFTDAALDSAVRAVVRRGSVSGYTLATATVTNDSVAPTVAGPKEFALIVYNAARAMVAPNSGGYSYKIRGMSEVFGNSKEHIREIDRVLDEVMTGELKFDGWDQWTAWLDGQ